MTIKTDCLACLATTEIEVSFFGGEIDSIEPTVCGSCQEPLCETTIEKLAEEAYANAANESDLDRALSAQETR